MPQFAEVDHHVLEDLTDILARHGLEYKSFGVISGVGPTSVYAARLVEALPGEVKVRQTTVSDNTESEVRRVAGWLDRHDVDLLIATGGGCVLDVAKAAAKLQDQALLLAPTSLSSDSIASPIAVIRGDDNQTDSRPAQHPLAIVVDIDVVCRGPIRLSLAGLGDLMSNLSAVADWRLARDQRGEAHDTITESMSELPARRMLEQMLQRKQTPRHDEFFVRDLAQGLILGGMAMTMAGNSRPCSGAEHMISHAIDAMYPGTAMHGDQVWMASIFTSYLHGDATTGRRLQRLASIVGQARCPQDIGLDREAFMAAVERAPATRPGRFSILDLVTSEREREHAFDAAYGTVIEAAGVAG